MGKPSFEEITLIGISLGRKTTNLNGQSAIDCGSLWQKFELENCAEKMLQVKTGKKWLIWLKNQQKTAKKT